MTEEPTKLSTPTVPSGGAPSKIAAVDPNASTVLTASGEPMARELRKVSTTDVVPIPGQRRTGMWIAVALALAVIAAAAIMLRKPEPVVKTTIPSPPPVAASIVPAAQGRVALNAFPWGEVTSIRNVANGATVDLQAPFVTPAPVDLAPGTYEITLSNPAYRSPITRKVDVKAGEEQTVNVQFADPSTATLPQFSGGAP